MRNSHTKHGFFLIIAASLLFGILLPVAAGATNIVDTKQYAWSANAGWTNFKPPEFTGFEGVTVYKDHLEGYAWSECFGWFRLGTHTGGSEHTYGNSAAADYGVNHDGNGNLSGYAWSTHAGWINFNPTHGGVTIDLSTGSFDGYAYSESVGWIHFKQSDDPKYNVVTLYPLAGDLNGDNIVDLTDAILDLQVITGLNPVQLRTGYKVSGADVDGDDLVGIEELIYILQEEAGLR